MSALLLILLSAVLVCHYAPALTGMRVFEQVDGFDSSIGLAVTTVIVLTIMAPVSYLLEQKVLLRFDLGYLRTLTLIILAMALAQLACTAMSRSPRWTPVRPMFATLMSTNCAVLGIALLTAAAGSFTAALWMGIGLGLAFALMLLAFTTLQQRLTQANTPAIFRDAPIALITIGLMALGVMGLTGVIPD